MAIGVGCCAGRQERLHSAHRIWIHEVRPAVCHFRYFFAQRSRTIPYRETSYEYTISYVRSLSPSSPTAQAAAIDAIAAALRLPLLFDFDTLFRLDAVVAAKDHELFALLRIFLNDGLPEYKAWEESHPDALTKYSKWTCFAQLTLVLTIDARFGQGTT